MSSRGSQGGRVRSSVTYARPTSKAALEQIAGRPLSTKEIVSLTGAQAGAKVQATGGYVTAEWQRDGHTYQTAVILSRALTGDFGTPRADASHVTLANFSFIRDGNPGAQMEASVLSRQLSTGQVVGRPGHQHEG